MAKVNWSDHLFNFLAVILGVSLAFFVSRESEKSKLKAEFNQNIAAILEEVESDIYTFEDYQIPDNKAKLTLMKEAIQMIASQTGGDSINVKMMSFFDVNNYAPTNITINSLISSGRLDLISDFELKNKILYYQNLAEELIAQGDFQINFLMDQITPWFIEKSPYFMGNLNYIDHYKGDDSAAIMIFSLHTSFVENKIRKYEAALENAKELRNMLEKYKSDKGIE
ncbi:hypothetical protein [Ekhidna sp.]|uniref:hypothetical protein n=1 Tax=Ekhidna sp. TaxID=2608089 RepID=UPI003BAAD73B